MRSSALLTIVALLAATLFARADIGNTLTDSKMSAFVPNGMLTDIDFSRFWKEFKVDGHIRTDCGVDDIKDGLIGFDAYMTEPVMIAENTRERFRLEFLQIDLNIGNDTKAQILQTGRSREDDAGTKGWIYNHIFQFPLLSMVFKDNLNGAFCFEQGSTGIIYMSELDPSANIDLYRLKMMPLLASMLTEQGLINSIASCVSTEAYNALDPGEQRDTSSAKILRDVMDSFFYVNGCKGLLTVGNYSDNPDPLANTYNISLSNIHLMSTTTPLLKQTVRSVVNSYEDKRWCKPETGPAPMIMSQYNAQLVRPRVGEVKENGTTPPNSTFMKNDATTGDNSVILIWQRRDYSMFSYKCGKRTQ